VKCLGETELDELAAFLDSGRTPIITGETGQYDTQRGRHADNPVHKLLGIDDPDAGQISTQGKKFAYLPTCSGRKYYDSMRKDFDKLAVEGGYSEAVFYQQLQAFRGVIEDELATKQEIELRASPFVATQIARVFDKPHVFISNFKGLVANENATQTPEQGAEVSFPAASGSRIMALPFLGAVVELPSRTAGGKLTGRLPDIGKGLVVWCE
jgi:hypothetical protein